MAWRRMLFRQTILYLPSQVVGPLSQVVAAIVWTHWLAPGPYGLLTFLIASQDLLFLVCLSWWSHYTMRYLDTLDGAARRGFARSESPIFALTFAAHVVGTLIVLAFLGQSFAPRLALAAIAFAGSRSLLLHLGERARAQGRIAVYTMGQGAGSVLGFGLAYAAVAWIAPTPDSVLFGFALAQVLGIALSWRALGLTRGTLWPDRSILRAALAYGAPLLVAGGLGWTAQNGIRLVVERGAGAEALGLVAVGWGLGLRLSATLAMFVVSASFPLAVQSLRSGSRADAYRALASGGVLLTGLIVPAAVGLCFLAGPFVTSFVAAPFRATTIAVLPLAATAGAVRNIRMHIADPVFLLVERPRVNTAINLIDAAAVMICCAIGLATAGLVGAVAGCLVGTIVSAAAGFVLARTMAGFSYPYADGCRILAASGLMAFALAAVPWPALMPVLGLRMAAMVAAGAAVYATAIAAFYPKLVRRGLDLRPVG